MSAFATALSPREITGDISEQERALDSVSSKSARKHYQQVLEVARAAARELGAALAQMPPNAAAICRLVNTFSWANRRLWFAAQQVCDVDDLKDEGAAEAIIWEIAL